jgi:hypothetical protein
VFRGESGKAKREGQQQRKESKGGLNHAGDDTACHAERRRTPLIRASASTALQSGAVPSRLIRSNCIGAVQEGA